MAILNVTHAQAGKRVDVLLAQAYPQYSRAYLQRWIRDGRVLLGPLPLRPSYRVTAGETIEVREVDPQTPPVVFTARASTIPILFEDGDLLVINKPAGLVTHPAPSHTGLTLVDWLRD